MAERQRACGRCWPVSRRPNVQRRTPTSEAASSIHRFSRRRSLRSCAGIGSPCSQRKSGLVALNVAQPPGTKKGSITQVFCVSKVIADANPSPRIRGEERSKR